MKARVLPPGSLGSYLRRPTPMASGDSRERSYSGKACLVLPLRACLDCRIAEVPHGKEALAGSNSPSCTCSLLTFLVHLIDSIIATTKQPACITGIADYLTDIKIT